MLMVVRLLFACNISDSSEIDQLNILCFKAV